LIGKVELTSDVQWPGKSPSQTSLTLAGSKYAHNMYKVRRAKQWG